MLRRPGLAGMCSVFPDRDGIGFRLGIRHGSSRIGRSLVFAAIPTGAAGGGEGRYERPPDPAGDFGPWRLVHEPLPCGVPVSHCFRGLAIFSLDWLGEAEHIAS